MLWRHAAGRADAVSVPGPMEIEERKFQVDQLMLGMFVCRLDRPWNGTPFPLQGFLIERPEQIEKLAELCSEVYVDVLRSLPTQTPVKLAIFEKKKFEWPKNAHAIDYGDGVPLQQEVPLAREADEQAAAYAMRVLEEVRAGRKLSAKELDQAVQPVVKSVIRNADAMFWLKSLRKRSAYAYSHALNCTALAAAFGRHLGFPEDILVKLASGGMLLDIGKAQLPDALLLKAGPLDDAERAEVRKHVEYSLQVLADTGNSSPEIVAMIRWHHERLDGSGYPDRLRGTEIPFFGRLAALIDSFDAMTSERPYSAAIARHEALQELYRLRGKYYQPELVEQFIQCIGVFPTGSLVELSTGEVAIVMAQNHARHLCPRVMVLTTPDKELHPQFHELDLVMTSAHEDPAQRVRIVRALQPGAYGLDPTELYL
jgi:HD-GYP domain-containing protein (c-di-GMP phosphodiesterase class II)